METLCRIIRRKEVNQDMIKKLLPGLVLLPLVIGTTGYIISGEMFSNALYAAFALYFTNPISDAYNLYIEIARWLGPLVTATAIICAIQSVWQSLRNRICLLGKKDSVSVYSDGDNSISFGKAVSAIYPGDKFKSYAQEHIIMFSSDQKNLQFYEEHRSDLLKKKVYIGIKDIEGCFLNLAGDITVFDINSSIARILWKEISLWNKGKDSFDLVVWGGNPLSGDIISTGLQLNLFSRNQKIRYHVIADNNIFRIRHDELKLMNDDELLYYDSVDSNIWDVISKADIVIISDIPDPETLQTIAVKAGESELYYYSPHEGDIASYFSYGNMKPFGREEVVFTDENIRRGGLIRKAIALNDHYANLYGTEKNWNVLSGFLKASNVSASDFGEVLCDLKGKVSEEEQAELEHIRWCRFMFLNYYTFGIPENGKNRDDVKRIHKDLMAFDELDPDEKVKDLEAIRITRNLYV